MERPVSTLPGGVGDLAPGVELMGLLAGVDRDLLSDFDRVEVLKARSRLRSHLDAELLADMAGILDAEISVVGSDLEFGEVHDVAAAEISGGLVLDPSHGGTSTRFRFDTGF